MSEQSVACAKASVMVYDEGSKKWIPSGSSGGLSKVQLYQHTIHNSFRIVGRKIQDHEVVINCAILKGLKYNQATPTFHQWRDNRQVYGLNFTSKDDAENFAIAMVRALEVLSQSGSSNQRASYQTQSNYQVTGGGPGGISLDEYAEYRGVRMNNENNSWKATTPEYATYATAAAVNHSSHPSTPGSASSPSAYGHHRTSSAPLNPQPLSTTQQQPSYQVISPPPPPPPPPTGNPSGSVTLPRQNAKSNPVESPVNVSLASALATAKLKKTPAKANDSANTIDSRHPPAIGNIASIMDEMTRTLARRRAQAENQDRESIGSNDSGKAGNSIGSGSSPSKNAGSESPQSSHRSHSDVDGENRSQGIDLADLERVKQEIINEMKKEVNKVKQEILEAIRMENNRR